MNDDDLRVVVSHNRVAQGYSEVKGVDIARPRPPTVGWRRRRSCTAEAEAAGPPYPWRTWRLPPVAAGRC